MDEARRLFAAGTATLGLLGVMLAPALAQPDARDVDVELVLAVDISMSMDEDEQRLQREGYVRAFLDSRVIDAIAQGAHGRIAVTYMNWAGARTQRPIIDWMMIDGAEAAAELSAALAEASLTRARRTSISAAIDVAADMFADNGYAGLRQVIDVSGDGANNQGRLVTAARDAAVERGLVINGLPFVPDPDRPMSLFDMPELDLYYADCVVGGPGSFSLPVYRKEDFAEAIRTKLILEIAGRPSPVVRVADAGPRVPCDYGERQWRRYFPR